MPFMPKQKLNKKQQELWDEWLLKDEELLKQSNKLEPGHLDNSIAQSQIKLRKMYFKRILEAADEHS